MSYQYVVIPNNCPTPQSLEIYHKVYDAWLKHWTEVFSEGERAFEPSTDDFLKQDYVMAIFEDENLVGFHLSSAYDLRKKMLSAHSYFSDFSPEAFENMKKEKLEKILSIEYLSVMPTYRKAIKGVSWASVLISLGQKLMCEINCDSSIGTPRTDIKVDVICKKLGYFEVQPPIAKYDYSCAVIVCPPKSIIPHDNPLARDLIESLWVARINYSEPFKKQEVA